MAFVIFDPPNVISKEQSVMSGSDVEQIIWTYFLKNSVLGFKSYRKSGVDRLDSIIVRLVTLQINQINNYCVVF